MTSHPAFAVLITYPLVCPSTDAILGSATSVDCRFATKREADAYAQRMNADADECSYKVELRPFRDGETAIKKPMFSAPELIADRYAFERDFGAPAWAL